MNGDVGIVGVLDVPFIWKGIATNNNLEPGIFKDKAHRPIAGVNGRDGTNGQVTIMNGTGAYAGAVLDMPMPIAAADAMGRTCLVLIIGIITMPIVM